MILERAIIRIAGPLLIFFGLLFAAFPRFFAEIAGISATAGGLTDYRAVYAGVQLGLGALLVWCGRDSTRFTAGLVALGLTIGGIGGIRLLGILIDGSIDAFQLANLCVEAATALLVAFALSRRQATRSGAAGAG